MKLGIAILSLLTISLTTMASGMDFHSYWKSRVIGPIVDPLNSDPWKNFVEENNADIYVQDEKNPGQRKIIYVSCSSNNFLWLYKREKEYITPIMENIIRFLTRRDCLNTADFIFFQNAPSKNIDFDQMDTKNMADLRKTFYTSGEVIDGTRSYHHGHPTDKVYVFLPGLFMTSRQFKYPAFELFNRGSNVIVTTLPGHEEFPRRPDRNYVGNWLAFTEYVSLMARQYGRQVILVGQSTGGTLAIRAAEKSQADGLILFQPFLGLRNSLKTMMNVGKFAPKLLLNNPLVHTNTDPKDIALIGIEDQKIIEPSFHSLSTKINIKVTIADNDGVVDPKAIETWIKTYAPHAEVTHHREGHMYISPVPEWER